MAQRPPIHLDEHAYNLIEMVEKEGIVAVAQRNDLMKVDRALLELMAGFGGAFKGSKEALQILKRDKHEVDERQQKQYTIRNEERRKAT